MLIAAGVPVKAIQERLGHASIVMTMDRYGHLLQTVDATLLAAVDAGLSATQEREPDRPAAESADCVISPPPLRPTPLHARRASSGPGIASPR